jgi:hypothetical protein
VRAKLFAPVLLACIALVTAIAVLPPAAKIDGILISADDSVRTDADVLDAERRVAAAIRADPKEAAAAARVLPRLRSRALAFRVARLLGAHLDDPAVHAAVLAALARGAGHAREVAAYAVYGRKGDAAIAAALARGFADPAASERVRAAHAFALARAMDDLAPEARDAVRREARRLSAPGAAGSELRAEAIALLDAQGADRDRLRALLGSDADRGAALAAARALLTTGEPFESIQAALGRFAGGDDLAARALRAMLEEPEPGPTPP